MSQRSAGSTGVQSEAHIGSERKLLDRALVLPLIGLVLLIPPLANAFHLDLSWFGIPFTVLYLFFVWGALIAGAALLAPGLRAQMQQESEADDRAQADEASEAVG